MNTYTLKDLAEIKHPYYCSESNYHSNEANVQYETMQDFLDDFEDADVDMNLCFRWDVHNTVDEEGYEIEGKYSAEVFLMLQRKGIFRPCIIKEFEEKDMDRFINYVQKHAETIKQIWAPFI